MIPTTTLANPVIHTRRPRQLILFWHLLLLALPGCVTLESQQENLLPALVLAFLLMFLGVVCIFLFIIYLFMIMSSSANPLSLKRLASAWWIVSGVVLLISLAIISLFGFSLNAFIFLALPVLPAFMGFLASRTATRLEFVPKASEHYRLQPPPLFSGGVLGIMIATIVAIAFVCWFMYESRLH